MSLKLDSAQNCHCAFLFRTHNKEMCTYFLYLSKFAEVLCEIAPSYLVTEWLQSHSTAVRPFHYDLFFPHYIVMHSSAGINYIIN